MEAFKFKQAIVVRRDIGMEKGKIAVQVGHAAVSAAEEARKKRRAWWKAWLNEGQCKVALKVSSEAELIELERKARRMKLPAVVIRDRGLTQIAPGTVTCLGLGPAPSELVDVITGRLPLL